jgi:hypothetical protein
VSKRVGGEAKRERGSDILSSPADTCRRVDTGAPCGHMYSVSSTYSVLPLVSFVCSVLPSRMVNTRSTVGFSSLMVANFVKMSQNLAHSCIFEFQIN